MAQYEKLFGVIPIILGFFIISFAFGFDYPPSEEEIALDTTNKVLEEFKKICGNYDQDTAEKCSTNIARIQGIVLLFGFMLEVVGIIIIFKTQ
jgi:hypothetical protein